MKIENIVIAMRLSGTRVLPEGYLYELLFKEGMTPEEATKFVHTLLRTQKLERIGCALVLSSNGKKDSAPERQVCNS